MLMVRLQRVGRKNDPSFRVVVVDSKEAAQSGKAIEVLGSHDARTDRTELKADRINYWLSVGAQASNTVNNLLIKKGVKEGKSIDVSSKKLGKKASAAVASAKAAEEKAAKEAEAKKLAEEKAKEEAVAEPVAEPATEEVKEETAEAPVEEVKEEVATEPVAE
jgi:small subunit ribosomal protein S16